MQRSLRRAWPGLAVVVLAVAACRPDEPIPRILEARLGSLSNMLRRDLTPHEEQQALARQLRIAPLPLESGKNPSDPIFPTQQTLTDFYARHGHRLAWCDEFGTILVRTTTLLEALRRADEHGLHPEDYALSQLDLLGARIGKGALDDAAVSRLADFDLLMTAAFFRYASDLSTGRVHPNEIREGWHTNPPELDFVAALVRALERDDLAKLLEALPPPHAGYARLRQSLKALREVESAGGWGPPIPEGPKLELDSRGPRVALLRQRFAVTAVADDLFDAALDEAVRDFQQRHGIEPDGKVASLTLAELNVPVDERIREVELNLERWRWIPRRLGDSYVVVNIPGFDLELVRDGATAWRTRIVAGKSYTPTPVFSDRIVAVVVNPPWNVPDSIALGEYLPELRQDPSALARHGLRLLEGSWEDPHEVDPTTVDWSKVDEGRFPYRLRQDPGADCALGRVKFDLTNDFHIYLHDTPAGHLFDRLERDLSHGCIRVENPFELAAKLLDGPSQDRLLEALDQPEERRLAVKPPVPVHILYWTAWVDEASVLRFGPDVYELDAAQRAALERVASSLASGSVSGGKRGQG